jgi:Leucine-rich repeat (LRR) protein
LVGTIPIEVDYFSQLQVLNLYYGKLTGSIPDFAPLQELEQLDFDGNDLSGNVPKSIFNLPKMKRLLLLNNKGLTGQIPEIGVDSQLERISLLGCSFSGPLSESLASISTLQLLQFRDNAFTGSLPASFFEMSELETLDVHGNQLVGSINSFTVNGSSKIETVAVGGNQLQGALPSSLGQLTSLKKFYAQENQFTGVVPVEIMSLPFLEQLWLYDNQFDAELPDTSVLSSTMRDLFLDKNNFAGSLDTLLANAPATLERIDVSSNSRIQGLVSDDIARFTSLVSFNASYCALTGGLRGDALSILSVLQSFAVAGNQMTDEIPSRIERMTNLQTLDLSNNDFSGAVPMELGNLQYLSYLDISGNPNLTGDLDSIICNSEFPVSAAVADCSGGEPVQCSCCTGCL